MSKTKNILSVSQLNQSAKRALEQSLPSVWVQGELTNLAQPSSGHWYFTLKDARAQVRCAMFRNKNIGIRSPIQAGDQVLLQANVSLYEGRGDYQLIVNNLQKAGLGDLHQQYEALKNTLMAEGLFAEQIKRPLPPMPKTIGVISSPTGAAVHDILSVLKRRYPLANVIIYPAQVQGTEAPQSLIKALGLANKQLQCDVIILGRGGGSLEDLWAFNNEQLVRSIYASLIPIISAVGHEVDFTLADFVADVRAPTPSAAAEAAVPDIQALRTTLIEKKRQLYKQINTSFVDNKRRLDLASIALHNPQQALRNHQQRLDFYELRLHKTIHMAIASKRTAFNAQLQQLNSNNPKQHLQQIKQKKKQLLQRLQKAICALLDRQRQRYMNQVALLNAVSPLNTLHRGYAIARNAQGCVISSVENVQPNTQLRITLQDGILETLTL
ncbi:exodeoxyribonuclease VII large subunit [Marinagarivorans algicola]|uniref:exodeoxyribonuclease VII large subunit n=1 Tax=Marinagarivorans algicola TaxID=1513270 RepID=UPI003735F4EB